MKAKAAFVLGYGKMGEGVARRLAEEAQSRQVVVFTHDVIFVHHLMEYFEELVGKRELDDKLCYQHVQRTEIGTGVCEGELPWFVLTLEARLNVLKSKVKVARELYGNGKKLAYEKKASNIYGYLREAWERAVEEVLLGKIVERFRPGVRTKHIKDLLDIQEKDCDALKAAMTKCSKWLTGHDQAPTAREEMPGPDILEADIKELEQWKLSIRNRRRHRRRRD